MDHHEPALSEMGLAFAGGQRLSTCLRERPSEKADFPPHIRPALPARRDAVRLAFASAVFGEMRDSLTSVRSLLLLFVASQYHLWSRLSSGSVFEPEFPRPVVIPFNCAFGAIIFLALLQTGVTARL